MYKIEVYQEKKLKEWDHFVLNCSMNGTFLQTRNFLNYHPCNRFIDYSLMVYKKNKLIAVVPACIIEEINKKELYSHKGSTFGGLIIKTDYYIAEKVVGIIDSIDEFCNGKFNKITLKITSDLFSVKESDLLKYCLQYRGYNSYNELSTYIDLERFPDDILSAFDRNKIRNIRKCEQYDLEFRELENDNEIVKFYELLEINLQKYNLKPIHTVNEILGFRHERIPNNVKFYGVFKENVEIAGGMLFIFEQTNVIHAQNLSADYRLTEYSPITYLYYRVIKQAKESGYKALSWGISTEDYGKVLNFGLIRNKESYGSRYQLNYIFSKIYQ